MKTIRGVNLGGWLVLEKWMTPELFEGTNALDEYHLLETLGDAKNTLLQKHRDHFIKEADFAWIKAYGLNTVRIPVGHWLFQADAPYVSCDTYLDKAFVWAKRYDLKVLIDVHAAPGCQNGFDNGGLSGVCQWHLGDNILKTLRLIKSLTEKYKHEPAFWGIELLNEPRWDLDLALIQNFYLEGYRIVRQLCPHLMVIFHDAFRLEQWSDFFTKNKFEDVMLDTHMYQVFSKADQTRNPFETLEKTSMMRYKELKAIDFVDVMIGEWSLGLHPNTLSQLRDDFQKDVMYRAVGNSLLLNFDNKSGWFFWNYRLSEKSTHQHTGWSFRDCVAKGYLPNKIKGD